MKRGNKKVTHFSCSVSVESHLLFWVTNYRMLVRTLLLQLTKLIVFFAYLWFTSLWYVEIYLICSCSTGSCYPNRWSFMWPWCFAACDFCRVWFYCNFVYLPVKFFLFNVTVQTFEVFLSGNFIFCDLKLQKSLERLNAYFSISRG